MEGQGPIEAVDNNVDARFQNMSALNCSGRTMGTWYKATPPLCRCNTKIGPIDNFGKVMVANLPSNIKIGVVHVAVAGCKIELFDKVNYASYIAGEQQWMKDIIALYGNNPYGRLVEVAKLAQKDGVIKGILMHQGESNTGDSQWPNKVKAVYQNLLTDLGLKATDVPLLAGQVVDAAQGGQCASMNSTINSLPNTIPTAHVISSSGCTDQSDNLHFTSAGYRLLGERYANKMLSLLPTTPVGSPTVSITAPTATSTFSAPATVSITATATDSDGSITKVEFFNGTTSLGSDQTSPYTFSWTNVAAGTYSITAVATDNAGNKTTSAAVAVKVRGPYNGTAHPIPGTIQFEEYDEGGNNVAYYDSSPGTSVPTPPNYRSNEDVDLETCTDAGAGYNLGYTVAGEWLEYTVNVASAGKYNINIRVACSGTGRTISLKAKGVDIATNIAIPNTGGWQTWQDLAINDVTLEAGEQIIRITIGATDYVNLNYMTFTTVAPVTSPPTVTSPVSYCQGATATALTATGTALKWYTVATGGTASTTAPTPATTTVGSTTYYVSQTLNSVESARASIVVNVTATPSAPTVVSPVTYTQGATATALTATGTALKWYTAATGGTGSSTAPTPSTTTAGTTSYYVSQTVSTCESPRAEIKVTVNPLVVKKITLKAGWNMVGCPLSGSTDIATALSSIWSQVLTVKDMNAYYISTNQPYLNTLTKLDWGKGYMIKVSQTCELTW